MKLPAAATTDQPEQQSTTGKSAFGFANKIYIQNKCLRNE